MRTIFLLLLVSLSAQNIQSQDRNREAIRRYLTELQTWVSQKASVFYTWMRSLMAQKKSQPAARQPQQLRLEDIPETERQAKEIERRAEDKKEREANAKKYIEKYKQDAKDKILKENQKEVKLNFTPDPKDKLPKFFIEEETIAKKKISYKISLPLDGKNEYTFSAVRTR